MSKKVIVIDDPYNDGCITSADEKKEILDGWKDMFSGRIDGDAIIVVSSQPVHVSDIFPCDTTN